MKNPPIDICAHRAGTKKGEEWAFKGEREPGAKGDRRSSRFSTSVNPKQREPIDPRMPHLPPA